MSRVHIATSTTTTKRAVPHEQPEATDKGTSGTTGTTTRCSLYAMSDNKSIELDAEREGHSTGHHLYTGCCNHGKHVPHTTHLLSVERNGKRVVQIEHLHRAKSSMPVRNIFNFIVDVTAGHLFMLQYGQLVDFARVPAPLLLEWVEWVTHSDVDVIGCLSSARDPLLADLVSRTMEVKQPKLCVAFETVTGSPVETQSIIAQQMGPAYETALHGSSLLVTMSQEMTDAWWMRGVRGVSWLIGHVSRLWESAP
jgi:hypothetical protein